MDTETPKSTMEVRIRCWISEMATTDKEIATIPTEATINQKGITDMAIVGPILLIVATGQLKKTTE